MNTEQQSTNNINIKSKINSLIFIGCYVIATFSFILISELMKASSSSTTTGLEHMNGLLLPMLGAMALAEVITYISFIALPIFGVWLLLQKFVFKNFPYTDQSYRKIRKVLIIFSTLLLVTLIIQAAQY